MEKQKKSNLINENKNRILELLHSVNRSGMTNFISYLENSDFFTAKGSHRHHRWSGGLAAHSLGVYNTARLLAPRENPQSLIIAALLHDICKAQGWPVAYDGRHGSFSVKIAESCGLILSPNERRAIRWHMSHNPKKPNDDWQLARKEGLRNAIHAADCIDCCTKGLIRW